MLSAATWPATGSNPGPFGQNSNMVADRATAPPRAPAVKQFNYLALQQNQLFAHFDCTLKQCPHILANTSLIKKILNMNKNYNHLLGEDYDKNGIQ